MQSTVEGVIYFYVFVCIALMVFNILYIARSSWAERKKQERARYWKRQIDASEGRFVLSDRQVRRLRRIQYFAAFHQAVTYWVLGTESSGDFFCDNARQIQELALYYARREPLERAFMASFIASFRCSKAPNTAMLAEILLSYLYGSTVYCRENVLQALYALGLPHAVENAFGLMNEEGWYHSPKLLSDGMTMYTGNMEELVLILWRNRARWAEWLNMAVVQFATFLDSPAIADKFEHALEGEDVTTEVRFALIRYFGRHPRETVLSQLVGYVAEDGTFSVPAAAALASYDCARSRDVLKQALHSGNWYVRHNAANALMRLGLTEDDWMDVARSNDLYAEEMLVYVAGLNDFPEPVASTASGVATTPEEDA